MSTYIFSAADLAFYMEAEREEIATMARAAIDRFFQDGDEANLRALVPAIRLRGTKDGWV